MGEDKDEIFEHREELMVSATGGRPTLRAAHFLHPSVSIDGPVPELPSPLLNLEKSTRILKGRHMGVHFRGWVVNTEKLKQWVQKLKPKFQYLWKEAGIYEAIMSSTYVIKRHKTLILGIAEKWSPETNTFIFPWGEATITLEDMMVCGGFSVTGSSISSHLRSQSLVAIEEKLMEARREVAKSCGRKIPSLCAWMDFFMDSGHELEHEAFLSYWLSKFVLSLATCYGDIKKLAFPIAICLARGSRVALAPVVLSGLYKELGVLKNRFGSYQNGINLEEILVLYAPFQYVQIWMWERFPGLRPIPNSLSIGEPRVARWHGVKGDFVHDVEMAIDSARESFQWRPYGIAVKNWTFPKFYGDGEQWITVDSEMDEELQSFAMFVRVSVLVGVEGCIEQYLPNRVAMQFGLDQDLPGRFSRENENPGIAWRNYSRPVTDAKLYIPARLFESDVSTRYSDWWKKSNSGQCDDAIKPFTKRRRTLPRKNEDDHLSFPLGFESKRRLQNIRRNDTNGTLATADHTLNPCDTKVKPLTKRESGEISCEIGDNDEGQCCVCGKDAVIVELKAQIRRLEKELKELKAAQRKSGN